MATTTTDLILLQYLDILEKTNQQQHNHIFN